MADIPFTLRSYEKVGARSTRKGHDIALREPGVREAVDALGEARERHKERVVFLRKNKAADEELKNERDRYFSKRDELRQNRNAAVRTAHTKALARLERELKDGSFCWQLSKGPKVGSRSTYKISDDFYRRITAKQVEAALDIATRRYKPSRHSIVKSLKQALDKSFSYGVVRLDIRRFFDSIPHDELLKKVVSNSRIDSITKTLVNQLVKEFGSITEQTIGVPQGVGMSSKLAEAYLRAIDNELITDSKIAFYARFVDDIIIITKNPETVNELKLRLCVLLQNVGLSLNSEKSYVFQTDKNGVFPEGKTDFEFLGYRFTKPSKDSSKVYLSNARISRIEAKLQRAFNVWEDAYARRPNQNNSGIDGLLLDRVRFLTSNTSLHNAKEKVAVGIFFSNREINEFDQLKELDDFKGRLIAEHQAKMPESLKEHLKRNSFHQGFMERRFCRFDMHKLRRISACWGDLG